MTGGIMITKNVLLAHEESLSHNPSCVTHQTGVVIAAFG